MDKSAETNEAAVAITINWNFSSESGDSHLTFRVGADTGTPREAPENSPEPASPVVLAQSTSVLAPGVATRFA